MMRRRLFGGWRAVARTWQAISLLLVLMGGAWTTFASESGACPTAPAPRLRIGMAVVVSPDVGTLNLRALPARDTGVVTRLYADTPLTVIGGRSCNGVYGWWRVETAGGQRGWVAEGDWDLYYLIPARDLITGHTPTPFEWSCESVRDVRRCPLP
ncbi:MAG: SH3 domain-containing protein [Chloroflexota bacterium]|nr:SH3 domain-containing protein [Chloroflexota bacterium]